MSESRSSSADSDSGRSRSQSSSSSKPDEEEDGGSQSGSDSSSGSDDEEATSSTTTTSTTNSDSNQQSENVTSGSDSELSAEDMDRPLYPKYLSWFKMAINKIKGQKQRPAKDRIFQAIRQYANTEGPAAADLPPCTDALIRRQMDLAVEGGHLFLVYCNGMESYKDTEYTRNLRKYVVKDDKTARKAVKLGVREIGNPKGTLEETIVAYVKCTFAIEVRSLDDVAKNALAFLTNKKELINNNGYYNVAPTAVPTENSSRPKSSMSSSSLNKSDEKKKKKKRKKKEKELLEIAELSAAARPSSKSKSPKKPNKSSSKSPVKFKSTPEEKEKRKSSPKKSSSPEIAQVVSPSRTTTTMERSAERKPGMSKLDMQLSKAGSAARSITLESVNSPVKKKGGAVVGGGARVQSPSVARKEVGVAKKKRGRPFKNRDSSLPSTSHQPPSDKKAKSPPPQHHAKASTSESDEKEPTNPLFETLIQSTPKELRDGLSLYFTPSLKRKSRVAMNSLMMSSAVPSPQQQPTTPKPPRPPRPPRPKKEKVITIQTTDSEVDNHHHDKSTMKTPKSEMGTTETSDAGGGTTTGTDTNGGVKVRKRGKKSGSGQLKGLQDGLSRYFTAPEGDRKRRPPPTFTPSRGAPPPRSVERVKRESSSEGEEESLVAENGGKADVGSRDSSRGGLRVPEAIPKHYEEIFRKARQKALETIPIVAPEYEGPLPPHVQIGKWKIRTWFTSPFPEEYIRCECLYLCEFCMQYMKTVNVLKSHYAKCPWHRPPGTEIYHDTVTVQEKGKDKKEELIVYETDGNDWKEYCQNLCLLAKLYLDHKTLYYDVEPFLFYVLCRRDEFGDHLIGYFSKEKNSPQRYNVSCIMVLPPYQTSGYGRFLIDFSYLLSRVEVINGTPEKPLSELGQISYQSYWRAAVLDFLVALQKKSATKISFKDICNGTGMWPQDVADTLQQMNFLQKDDKTNKWEIRLIKNVLEDYHEKQAANKKRIVLIAEKLHWEPWSADNLGVTSTESDRSSSRVKTNGKVEAKPADVSHDTSDSEADQAVEVRPTSAPTATATAALAAATTSVRHVANPSRSRTPRGWPSTHRSVSKQRSSPERASRVPASTSPDKRRRGRPPKGSSRRRDSSGGQEETVVRTGTRKRRRGKMRKKVATSSASTSSQPKNCKGRGEELRAGGGDNKHHKHRKITEYEDNSDIASLFSSPRRASSSTSLSSLDESLASVSDSGRNATPSSSVRQPKPSSTNTRTTEHRAHQHHSRQSRRSLDRESLASERSSSSGRSHLDQPPRAPHPVELNEPLDLLDAVTVNDSPFGHPPDALHYRSSAASATVPVTASTLAPPPPQRGVEICVQTEPELFGSQAEVLMRGHAPEIVVPAAAAAAAAVEVMKMLPTLATQTSHPMNPLSPNAQASQPTTPFPLGSPQMSLGSVGPAPGSVLSNHELQMTQETEHMMATVASVPYDNPRSYERQYQPRTPASTTSPLSYQTYQQPSPAAVPVYQDVSRPATAQPPYADMTRQPHTPLTPQSAYMESTQTRPGTAFAAAENVHSPHQHGRMHAGAGGGYSNVTPEAVYAAARAQSVAPGYVDSSGVSNRRNSVHFSPEQEYAQPHQQQQAQYSSKSATASHSGHHQQQLQPATSQSKSRSRQPTAQRFTESPAAASLYPQHMVAQQTAQSSFYFGQQSMRFLPFSAMPEPYHYEMQASSAELAKMSRMTQSLPQDAHGPMVGYQQMTAPPSQRSQSHSRQNAQSANAAAAAMRMPMNAALPPGYANYGMPNMQNLQQAYAAQSHPMSQGYTTHPALFSPQTGGMPGQPRHGVPHQSQGIYQNLYYPGSGHGSGQHHHSMR